MAMNSLQHQGSAASLDPDAVCAEDELLFAVMSLKRAWRQLGDLDSSGLEAGAFPVLHHLACAGSARPGQIAEAIGLDASTVSRHIRKLTRRGLIVSLPDPTDGRASVLTVSSNGRTLLSQGLTKRREAMARGMASLTSAERDELVRLLAKFTQAISPFGDQHSKTLESR